MEKLRAVLTPKLFIAMALLVTAYGALTGQYLVYIALAFSILGFLTGQWSKREPERAARFVSWSLLAYYAWEAIRGLFGDHLFDYPKNLYLDTLVGRDSPFLILGFVVLFVERLLRGMSIETLAKHSRYALVIGFIVMVGGVWAGFFPLRYDFLADNPMKIAYMTAVAGFIGLLDWKTANLKDRLFGLVTLLMAFLIQTESTLGRGSLLVMVAMLPALILYMVWSISLSNRQKLLGVLGASILAIIGISFGWSVIADNDMGGRLINIVEVLKNPEQAVDIDWSIAQRLFMWEAAYEAISAHPILGYGSQMRFEAVVPYLNIDMYHYSHVHNTLMSNWLAGGILGVLLYLNVVFLPFTTLFLLKQDKLEFIYFATVLSGALFLTGLTDESFYSDLRSAYWVFYLMLFYALAVLSKRAPIAD